jgi:hypothetical protein
VGVQSFVFDGALLDRETMLGREKRRAVWSLAAGIVVAGLVLGWGYIQAQRVRRTLRTVIADCEKPINAPKDDPLANAKRICDPKELMEFSDLRTSPLEGDQGKIEALATEADDDRASSRFRALAVLLIFCLPLAWYFVLDRIREISAAVAGRDRSP